MIDTIHGSATGLIAARLVERSGGWPVIWSLIKIICVRGCRCWAPSPT